MASGCRRWSRLPVPSTSGCPGSAPGMILRERQLGGRRPLGAIAIRQWLWLPRRHPEHVVREWLLGAKGVQRDGCAGERLPRERRGNGVRERQLGGRHPLGAIAIRQWFWLPRRHPEHVVREWLLGAKGVQRGGCAGERLPRERRGNGVRERQLGGRHPLGAIAIRQWLWLPRRHPEHVVREWLLGAKGVQRGGRAGERLPRERRGNGVRERRLGPIDADQPRHLVQQPAGMHGREPGTG